MKPPVSLAIAVVAFVVIALDFRYLATDGDVAAAGTGRAAAQSVAAAPVRPRSSASDKGPVESAEAAARGSSPADNRDSLADNAGYAERALSLAAGDFPTELAAKFGMKPGEQRDVALMLLLRRWGQLDHVAALAAVGGLPALTIGEKMKLENLVYDGWLAVDPEGAWGAAVNYYQTSPSWSTAFPGGGRGDIRRLRIQAVTSGLVETGQVDAAAKLLSTAPADVVGATSRGIAVRLARSDLAAAQKWSAGLTGTARGNADLGIAAVIAETDVSAADRYLESTGMTAEMRAMTLKEARAAEAARPR